MHPKDFGWTEWPNGKWCILNEGYGPHRLFYIGGAKGVLVFKQENYQTDYFTVVLGGNMSIVIDENQIASFPQRF